MSLISIYYYSSFANTLCHKKNSHVVCFSNLRAPPTKMQIQNGAEVGLRFEVHETKLILYYFLLIIVLYFTRTTVNLLWPPPCINKIMEYSVSAIYHCITSHPTT